MISPIILMFLNVMCVSVTGMLPAQARNPMNPMKTRVSRV